MALKQEETIKEHHSEVFKIIDEFIIYKFFTLSEIVTKLNLSFAKQKKFNQEISESDYAIFFNKKCLNSTIVDIINDRPLLNQAKAFNDKFFND